MHKETSARTPVIGITLGDAAGIGPELVCKVAASGFLNNGAIPVIIGQEDLLLRGMRQAKVHFPYQVITSPGEAKEGSTVNLIPLGNLDVNNVRMGKTTAENGKAQGDDLIHCIHSCQQGELDGFCFAPLNKSALKMGGFQYPSEHEMFAEIYGQEKYFGEINYLSGLWNMRVTSHIPFCEVCEQITIDSILETAQLGHATIQRAGCKNPTIAVAALNPHRGEDGTCGREEIDIIVPAIEKARAMGLSLEGPIAADVVFVQAFKNKYTGVLTMYHDQGQIAVKLHDFLHCVTISAGFPHPITTPAHGTAYDIAGTGTCIGTPFEEAYEICKRMVLKDMKYADHC